MKFTKTRDGLIVEPETKLEALNLAYTVLSLQVHEAYAKRSSKTTKPPESRG